MTVKFVIGSNYPAVIPYIGCWLWWGNPSFRAVNLEQTTLVYLREGRRGSLLMLPADQTAPIALTFTELNTSLQRRPLFHMGY